MPSPVGLAAGFDKDGEAIDGLFGLGFDWSRLERDTQATGGFTTHSAAQKLFIELATALLLLRKQGGNPKPRVFTLPEDDAMINRYGFPSRGHDLMIALLRTRSRDSIDSQNTPASGPRQVLAVNLGKNKSSPPDSIADYLAGVRKFGAQPDVSVLVINVSSPNTPGLRGLQNRGMLEELLEGVCKERDALPRSTLPKIVLKIAPDLDELAIQDVAEAVRESGVDGVIGRRRRSADYLVPHSYSISQGLKVLRAHLPAGIPIIGCGGISSGADALEFARAGASSIQLYTAFGYSGVGTARRIKDELSDELKRLNTTWEQVVDGAIKSQAWVKPEGQKALDEGEQELRDMLDFDDETRRIAQLAEAALTSQPRGDGESVERLPHAQQPAHGIEGSEPSNQPRLDKGALERRRQTKKSSAMAQAEVQVSQPQILRHVGNCKVDVGTRSAASLTFPPVYFFSNCSTSKPMLHAYSTAERNTVFMMTIVPDYPPGTSFDKRRVSPASVALATVATYSVQSVFLYSFTMRATFVSVALLAAVLPALAAPTTTFPSASTLVRKLKDGVSKDAHVNKLVAAFSNGGKVQYKYGDVFHGYAASISGKDLDFIRQSSDVEYIVEDGIMTIDYEQGDETAAVVAREAPAVEGLDKRANGAGVDVYGIDTGIYTAHSSFGGRARWGATFGGYANQDGNGHGTHTAGTAVGASYGVATSANIIAVKVLSDAGSGTNSDVIAGINWAATQARSSGRPSVANLSLGGGANTAVDSAVSNAVAGGLHFAIAAGNSNVDAGSTSPARVAAANTVGAVDSSNRKASFSNYAPGSVELPALNTISGTSMASPRVAGYIAVHIGNSGGTPSAVSSALKSSARAVVTGAPSGTTNLLAQPF
ncbi:dihydroorotate dehydrogenase family Type 2 subfamily [Rhizoctonia solani]|uniref:Dihydroorotate dehydrogenase (quinone), mitochondrial n=1 Tax=Rhizoctonia solani TaxID=456999 RepID=A0A8H7I7P9_9AGAM|nr:dihydroorotate dehydrogenase family Type 2 subfamily [Rhizoctonia solani]